MDAERRWSGLELLYLLTWVLAWLWTLAVLRAPLTYEFTRGSTVFFGLHGGLTAFLWLIVPALVMVRTSQAPAFREGRPGLCGWLYGVGREIGWGLGLEARLLAGIAPCVVLAWRAGAFDGRIIVFALVALAFQGVVAAISAALWGRLVSRHPVVGITCALLVGWRAVSAGRIPFHWDEAWWELIHLEVPAYLGTMAERTQSSSGYVAPFDMAVAVSMACAVLGPVLIVPLLGLWRAVALAVAPRRAVPTR